MPTSRKLGRSCACGTGIYDGSKTGRCRPCHFRAMRNDPKVIAACAEVLRVKYRDDPSFRAQKRASLVMAREAARKKPEFMRFLAESGPRFQAMRTPETEAKRIAALVAANKRRIHNPWLPASYKALYRRLQSNHRHTAEQAKAVILAKIEADNVELSPFERQERALANGAALVAKVRINLHSPAATELRAKLA